jgi:excisionase family DNA binding protein
MKRGPKILWQGERLLLTTEEAGKLIGKSDQMTRRYCQQGRIPHIRIGKSYRIPVSVLKDWIEEQAAKSVRQDEPELPEAA